MFLCLSLLLSLYLFLLLFLDLTWVLLIFLGCIWVSVNLFLIVHCVLLIFLGYIQVLFIFFFLYIVGCCCLWVVLVCCCCFWVVLVVPVLHIVCCCCLWVVLVCCCCFCCTCCFCVVHCVLLTVSKPPHPDPCTWDTGFSDSSANRLFPILHLAQNSEYVQILPHDAKVIPRQNIRPTYLKRKRDVNKHRLNLRIKCNVWSTYFKRSISWCRCLKIWYHGVDDDICWLGWCFDRCCRYKIAT